MDVKQRKIEFIELLKKASRHYTDAPNFEDKETLVEWGGALFPFVDRVSPLLIQALAHFEKWPSVRKILEMIGETPKTNAEIAKQTAANIWAYMETAGTLTPLGERVFDSLGGWDKLGHIHFDYTSRRTYDLLFNQKALELISQSQDNLLPKLPAPEPESKIDWSYAERKSGFKRGTEAFENWCKCENICKATRNHLFNREGHGLQVTEPFEDRKQKAKERGDDFYEPPRYYEMPVEYEMTAEDKKMWNLKLKQIGFSF
jgi:hypothetical protein